MQVKQFEDKFLSQFSYAIESEGEIVIIDPERNPHIYYEFASSQNAKIIGVIETHLHADFVSSHLEIHKKTNATIYVSKLAKATYPHQSFDEGNSIKVGRLTLKAINTPGHSPESICILLIDETEKEKYLFTGDTLFVGDVGRPDLREESGNMQSTRKESAKALYYSTREKLMKMDEHVLVYPAHGMGSLCGKALSSESFSSIGKEIKNNPSLQPMLENKFVDMLLEGQPFIPPYFPYNIKLNIKGADSFEESAGCVIVHTSMMPEPGSLVVDARPANEFRYGHIKGAINIPNGPKFETWLGTIVLPDENFYLLAIDMKTVIQLIYRTAKIGYEKNIIVGFRENKNVNRDIKNPNLEEVIKNTDTYTIIDVRNESEFLEKKLFKNSINIPLPSLRKEAKKIPSNKPMLVHCAGGYRSAIGSSILAMSNPEKTIYDLGENVKSMY